MKSRSISRVLSRTIIHLGQLSPTASSNLPESSAGHTYWIPIWSCSEWGLPSPHLLPAARCALTAPFHPYQEYCYFWRFTLCCTFRRLSPPRRYLALYPLEPGLSSLYVTINSSLKSDCLTNFSGLKVSLIPHRCKH